MGGAKCVCGKATIQMRRHLNKGLKEMKNACIREGSFLGRGNSQYVGFKEAAHLASLKTPRLLWLGEWARGRIIRDEAGDVIGGWDLQARAGLQASLAVLFMQEPVEPLSQAIDMAGTIMWPPRVVPREGNCGEGRWQGGGGQGWKFLEFLHKKVEIPKVFRKDVYRKIMQKTDAMRMKCF